jgi:hypothetical protein
MRINPEGREFSKKEMLPMPKELDENLVNKSAEQLEIIKESLQDFVKRIQEEEPDMVFFMDKSARVFGEPIFRYLNDQKMLKMPEIRFYNDDYLKGLYLNGKLDKKSVDKELYCLEGKKIFFLDETFSGGKGAATIKKSAEFIDNCEIFYFALTQDKRPKVLDDFGVWFTLSEEEHKKNLKEISDDDNFKIYDNDIGELFSREVSKLYVMETDENGKLRTVNVLPYGSSKKINVQEREIIIPNSYDFNEGYEYPCDKKEYFRLKEKEKQNTINVVKEKILETLRQKDEEQ